jgi:hypothetical protein
MNIRAAFNLLKFGLVTNKLFLARLDKLDVIGLGQTAIFAGLLQS